MASLSVRVRVPSAGAASECRVPSAASECRETLAKHGQRDLGTQLKRCAPSVVLNLAEGSGLYNGNARLRFETAIGSAREVIACLEVGGAMGVLEAEEVAEAVDCADKVVATLWKVVRGRA